MTSATRTDMAQRSYRSGFLYMGRSVRILASTPTILKFFVGFPGPSTQMPRYNHDRFLPNPFQFIILFDVRINQSPGSRKPRLTVVGSVALTTRHPLPQKLALTSLTCGGRSVGIVRLRTKATEHTSVAVTTRLSDG
jgi:hypothetical protein